MRGGSSRRPTFAPAASQLPVRRCSFPSWSVSSSLCSTHCSLHKITWIMQVSARCCVLVAAGDYVAEQLTCDGGHCMFQKYVPVAVDVRQTQPNPQPCFQGRVSSSSLSPGGAMTCSPPPGGATMRSLSPGGTFTESLSPGCATTRRIESTSQKIESTYRKIESMYRKIESTYWKIKSTSVYDKVCFVVLSLLGDYFNEK